MTKSTGVGRGNNPASHQKRSSGASHYRWNDGRMLSSQGYVKVRVGRGHPLADANGYAYEHLLVWVAAGNPKPPSGWLLHHENENKADNRLTNLALITKAEHNRLHMAERQRDTHGRMVGKKAAGRLLDGREHNEFPEVQHA